MAEGKAAESAALVLKVENLTFGVTESILFEDLDFVAASGEILAILGPTGIGKTTLLRTILLMNDKWKGCCRFGDKYEVRRSSNSASASTLVLGSAGEALPLTEEILTALRHDIGYVPQAAILFPHINVEVNVALPLRARGERADQALSKSRSCLDALGLASLAHRKPWQLSGGQKQQIALARAIIGEPRLLLLDEPTSSADPATAVEIRNVIKRYVMAGPRSAIIVSHDVVWSGAIADKVLFLGNDGVAQTFRTTENDRLAIIKKMQDWFSDSPQSIG
jgi:molybdate transport system ATP-binding protein